MIPIPAGLTYELDEENWGKRFDPSNEGHHTHGRLNNYITLQLVRYQQKQYEEDELWEEFREGFEGWTQDLFDEASREALKELRTYLVDHGVWVRPARGIKFSRALIRTLEEETQHQWTDDEITEEQERRDKATSRVRQNSPVVREPSTVREQGIQEEASGQIPIVREPIATQGNDLQEESSGRGQSTIRRQGSVSTSPRDTPVTGIIPHTPRERQLNLEAAAVRNRNLGNELGYETLSLGNRLRVPDNS
jgi:hypothetical protein